MDAHHRLTVEKYLAHARQALYRAIGAAESAAAYGLEDDLTQINLELARVMDSVMKNRPSLTRDVDNRT